MRALLFLIMALGAATAAAQPAPALFVHGNTVADPPAATSDQRGSILARTRVQMRLDVLFDAQNGAARRVLLNAGGHEWIARFERRDDDAQGFRSWVGGLEDIADSHVVFTERDGVVSGLINAVGVTYQVRTERAGTYLLELVDLAALGDEREPLDGAGGGAVPPAARDLAAGDDPHTIDLLILYSPAARSKLGDTAQIEALASQVVSDTNTAFARSGVTPRVRLVGAFELGFTEAQLMSDDLPRVRASAEARLLRDVLRADAVQLLVSSPDLASCGIGYLLAVDSPDFDAYSVADVSCVAQYTPTHELAHNMGSHHAPEDGASGALFPYSYAYKDPERGFRTVMAYPCANTTCLRIPNFSNPGVVYVGGVTGSAAQHNARSLNEAAPYVANFRSTRAHEALPPSAPTGLRSTVAGNVVTVSWNPVLGGLGGGGIGATSYVLQAGTSPGAANFFNASIGHATSASGAVPDGTYFWRVVALNSAGASAPSAEAQFVVGSCVAPLPPGDFRFTIEGRIVTLSWQVPPLSTSPVSYVVEAGSLPALANLLVAPVGSQTSVVTPAPPGTYYVRVRAATVCGTSAPSNEQIITVP